MNGLRIPEGMGQNVRIISGSRRGHKLFEFEGEDIRPTTDRVKESIFNMIQFYISGANVLDLFAGSGALAFEAVSRGAAHAVLVDQDKRSVALEERNLRALRFDKQAEIVQADVFSYLKSRSEAFDIIFMDPPYNQGYVEPVLDAVCRYNALKPGGIVVLETDETDEPSEHKELTALKRRKYGRSVITVFERRQEGQA